MFLLLFIFYFYSDTEAAIKATENLDGEIILEFGSSSTLQIRYADLEIDQSDVTRNLNRKNENDGKNEIQNGNDNNNNNDNNNLDIIFQKLNMNRSNNSGSNNDNNRTSNNINNERYDGLKFNSYYVNPEPVCCSTTDNVTVPGFEIIKGIFNLYLYYDSNLYSFNWRICIYMCMREIECMCLCMRETNILKRECSCKFSCCMRDATTNILSHKFEFITSTFSFVIIDVTSIKIFYRMYIMIDIYSLCIGVCVRVCVCKKG